MTQAATMSEQDIFELLIACGFTMQVEETHNLTTVGFDILPFRGEISNCLLQYRDEKFSLLFPYRYPSDLHLEPADPEHIFEIQWEMDRADIIHVYNVLTERVIALGGVQADVARYLHCYIACPRVNNRDFSNDLDFYTPADLLRIATHTVGMRPDTLTELITHRVAVDEILTYDDTKMSLSLFLEMYTNDYYDHIK